MGIKLAEFLGDENYSVKDLPLFKEVVQYMKDYYAKKEEAIEWVERRVKMNEEAMDGANTRYISYFKNDNRILNNILELFEELD